MSNPLREEEPVDYAAMWRMQIASSDERSPIPRMKTTSTGAPVSDGTVLVGPRDMCPEG